LAFKLIEVGANREPVYDFLLVINSNLGPILHRYWDTATYWPKIAGVPAAKMKFQDQLFSKFQDIFTVSKISTNASLLHVT